MASVIPFNAKLALMPLFENSVAPTPRPRAQNLVAIRNDSDLFFASENIIRCSTITSLNVSKTVKYHVLGDSCVPFDINTLSINSNGSLLAAIGDSSIQVFSLPEQLNGHQEESIRSVKRLLSVNGTIKKSVWYSGLANDALVLLVAGQNGQNEILVYDLDILLTLPQIKFPVADDIVSITFGSLANLQGSLTLYLLSNSGSIYGLYPFIYSAAKIRATRDLICDLYDESRDILLRVNDICELGPAGPSNPLKKAASDHYLWVQSIYLQITRPISPVEDSGYLVLEPVVVKTNFKVQGPLLKLPSTNNAVDLTHFLPNNNTGAISILHDGKVSIAAQFAPLLLAWDDSLTNENDKKQVQEKSNHYKPPSKGFGYIDDFDDDVDTVDVNSKVFKEEIDLWNSTFTRLTLLETAKLDNSSQPEHLLSSNSFIIASGNSKLLVIDGSKYADLLILQGPFPIKESLAIKRISKIPSSNYIYAVVRDIVGDLGTYLICGNIDGGIRAPLIKDGEVQVKETSKPLTEDLSNSSNIVIEYQSPLIAKPFGEILTYRFGMERKISKSKNISVPKGLIKTDDLDSLVLFNNAANDIVTGVSEFSAYIIKLEARIRTQLSELDLQIQQMTKLKDQELLSEEYVNRISKATERQEVLEKKLLELKEKVYNAVDLQYVNKNLPLSKAEKIWFKELNELTSQVNLGRLNESNELDDLENFTVGQSLSHMLKEIEEIKEASLSREDSYENNQKFAKIITSLQKKGIVIQNVRKNYEDQLNLLELKINK